VETEALSPVQKRVEGGDRLFEKEINNKITLENVYTEILKKS